MEGDIKFLVDDQEQYIKLRVRVCYVKGFYIFFLRKKDMGKEQKKKKRNTRI